jgi:hypothetical protein
MSTQTSFSTDTDNNIDQILAKTMQELEAEYDAMVREECEEDQKFYSDNEIIEFDECECP